MPMQAPAKYDPQDWVIRVLRPDHAAYDDFTESTVVPSVSAGHSAMQLRKGLSDLAPWPAPLLGEVRMVARAIESTLEFFDGLSSSSGYPLISDQAGHFEKSQFRWHIDTLRQGRVYFTVHRLKGGKWEAPEAEIEATLSLWSYGAQIREPEEKPTMKWGTTSDSTLGTQRTLRLLGPESARLRRDLRWWLPENAANIMAVRLHKPSGETAKRGNKESCRSLIGFGPTDYSPGWARILLTIRPRSFPNHTK